MDEVTTKTIAVLSCTEAKPPNPKIACKALLLHRKRVNLSPDLVAKNLGMSERELELMEQGELIPTMEQVGILCTLYGLNEKKVMRGMGYEGC